MCAHRKKHKLFSQNDAHYWLKSRYPQALCSNRYLELEAYIYWLWQVLNLHFFPWSRLLAIIKLIWASMAVTIMTVVFILWHSTCSILGVVHQCQWDRMLRHWSSTKRFVTHRWMTSYIATMSSSSWQCVKLTVI